MQTENNKNTQKTILLIIGAVLLVAILAIATTLLLKNIGPTSTNRTSQDQETIKQADMEYDKAQDSLAKGDLPTAKTSFEKAQGLYKQTNDKSHLKEIDAALSLIEHTNPKTTP